jgi:hypothetical protein
MVKELRNLHGQPPPFDGGFGMMGAQRISQVLNA